MNKIVLASVLLAFAFVTHARQFQWVAGGGSIYSPQYFSDWDQVTNLCTDSNRNIYAAIVTYTNNLTVDAYHLNQGHYPGIRTLMLVSYRCDGSYRWSRLFEGAGDSYTGGLVYDGAGSIYFSGDLNGIGYPKYIAGGSGTTANDNQSTFTARLDTSGNLGWIQFATPNTTAALYKSFAQQLAIDGAGNIHNYASFVKTGVQLSPTVTSEKGLYDFTYSPAGAQLGITRLNTDSAYIYMNAAAILKGSNKLIAHVYQDYSTGTAHYLAAFAPSGSIVWKDTLNSRSYPTSIAYDGRKGLYIAGSANGDNWQIQGQPALINTLAQGQDLSVIFKADTSGNIVWQQKIEHSIIGHPEAIALLTGGKLIAAGYTGATTRAGSNSFTIPPNEGVPYYTIMDTAGSLITLDHLHTNQLYNMIKALAVDKAGNAYMGGEIEDTVLLPGGQHYKSRGGNSDFFVAKFGYPCNCTAPVSSFTAGAPAGRTIQFTYNGTMSIDTLIWDFGDGQRQRITAAFNTPLSHTYAAGGHYNTCVTAYNSCGSASSCKSAALGILSQTLPAGMALYPIPAAEVVYIDGATGYELTLTDGLGRRVCTATVGSPHQSLSLAGLPVGTYTLQLSRPDGAHAAAILVKAD